MLPRTYVPMSSRDEKCIPYPLIAASGVWQVFFQGTPSREGWSNCVPQIVQALCSVDPGLVAVTVSDAQLERDERVRTGAPYSESAGYFTASWRAAFLSLTNAIPRHAPNVN